MYKCFLNCYSTKFLLLQENVNMTEESITGQKSSRESSIKEIIPKCMQIKY